MKLIKLLLLFIVYFILLEGNNNFDRCFASLQDAVPIFEIIGHKGSGSTVPNLDNLCYLAVSLNLPAVGPVVSYTVIE